jgi:hypothetical protein
MICPYRVCGQPACQTPSHQPQVDPEEQNQQKDQRDQQSTGGQKTPLDGIKEDSTRVYSMPEIVKHGLQPPESTSFYA